MNEATYAVWHGLMYCVGVFVTCNIGGMALRWGCERVSGLITPREDETPEETSVKAANDLNAVISGFSKGLASMAESMGTVITVSGPEAELVSTPRSDRQSFEDIQRQIGADAKRGGAETESVAPS